MDTQHQVKPLRRTGRTVGRKVDMASAPPRKLEGFRGFSVGRIAGVEIRLDWSLLIIFALIVVSLANGLFPHWHASWSPFLCWTLALVAGAMFIGSILLHELSHALVARTQGILVPRITLFVFGGVAEMESHPPSPSAEFYMAIIGPVVSIVLGLLSTLAGLLVAGTGLQILNSEFAIEQWQSIGPLATLLLWLGPINIILGLFNLVPGFPLDGGRVLRSILWALTKDIAKATRIASAVGQAFAWVLMGIGVLNLFAGVLGQGLWLLLIGWFLNNAARVSYQQLLIHKTLEDVPVSRLMMTKVDTVSSEISIEALVREHFMATDQHAFPVVNDDVLVGLVCLDDIRRVPNERWPYTRVGEVMTPAANLASLGANESAERALEELARRDVDQLPILDGRQILGLVRRGDIVKWMALQGT